MERNVFSIDDFNVISDDNYYYFFRALNMGDNNDIENNITLDDNGYISRIRTDRERYEEIPKYNEYINLTLEEIFDHIKMHHRKDTNCISLTSNANVAAIYGRGYYKDKYVMIKMPKNELGKDVVDAGFYMLSEVNNRINNIVNNNELDNTTLYYLSLIDNAKNQEELNNVISYIKTNINAFEYDDSIYEKGIKFTTTNSLDYNALNDEQNFYKNKIVAKLDIIDKNIIKNVSNRFLIQTIGNAFSSLELTHYKDIYKDKIIELPKEIVDIFSLLQQLPKDNVYVKEIKKDLLRIINDLNINNLSSFNYENLDINIDEEYTIENMYNLTNGTINFKDSYSLYKKSFYLSKSRLRTINSINNLNKIINNPKYYELFTYLQNNTFGVEPNIFTKLTSNKLKVSESVSIDITKNEMELFNFIRKLSKEELSYVINNPLESLKYYLNNFNLERINLDKETYYATSLVELFDWKKLGIDNLSLKHKNNIINKLKENNVVLLYNRLKSMNINEKYIANLLLTAVLREETIYENINLKYQFTLEELEDFLGYYRLKGTKLKLRTYQASAKKNIDESLSKHNFTCAILPTGAGKSFVSLAEMLDYKDKEILYLAPNDEILNQIRSYIIEYIYGFKNVLIKEESEIIKEIFPNLKLCTYSSLLSYNQKEIIDRKYNLIIFDELHRTGAQEWNKKILRLVNNQDNNTKVLGITATPQRDADLMNMADYWAEYFGYTEEEIIKGEHLAINMDLEDAIKLGYIVNPKVVECEYFSLNTCGLLDGLLDKIKYIQDEDRRNVLIRKHDVLRRKLDFAKGIEQVIGDNLKLGDKVIVFCPALNKDGIIIDNEWNVNATRSVDTINIYVKQLKEYLMIYYNTTEEEINSMVEFNSMLGEYGKAKNRRELELFEQDDKDKIKFMVVINKLNEGTHIKGVNKLIWFRPLDENSKILMQQQFGRIIKSKVPNKKIKEDDRPVAIDLVGNLVRVNISKKEKLKASDLDKMKLAINWIDLNNRIPDVNSLDKVERSYARSLKKIKNKYLDYINNNLLDNLSKKQKIETLEILRLGDSIDLWNYDFIEITNDYIKNKDEEIDNDFDLFKLNGILKDFIELDNEINLIMLSYEQRLAEYIEIINGEYVPKKRDYEETFSDATPINYFWTDNRNKIEEELETNPLYKVGYEIAKEKVKMLQSKREEKRNELSHELKLNEYIDLLNGLYYPKMKDSVTKFSDGTLIMTFWKFNRDRIEKELKTNPRYVEGYDVAKIKVKELQVKRKTKKLRLSFEEKINEYIKMINGDYEPKRIDSETKFSDGTLINYFWKSYRDRIEDELSSNIKYKEGFEVAKQKVERLQEERKKKKDNNNYMLEYIELINGNYVPKGNDSKSMFNDGTFINTFWNRNRDKIEEELNTNTKYQEGYEVAKEKVKKLQEERNKKRDRIHLKEYIEMINKDYNPKSKDTKTMFEDGTILNQFWQYYRDEVSDELNSNPTYIQGYDVAKEKVRKLKRETDKRKKLLSSDQRIAEYIEFLNEDYVPRKDDPETKFSDGTYIKQLWNYGKDKIAKELYVNPKYQLGYEKAKNIIEVYKNRDSINENIDNINNLCKYYNIDINKNKGLLKKSCNEVYAKICYLIDNNISICDNDGLVHEIFFMSDINMQAKYNISFKELIEKYVYDSNKFRSVRLKIK